VADEHLVVDLDPGAQERVAGDLAALADDDAALDLDEGPDLGLAADPAAVQVDECLDDDAVTEDDVVDQATRGVVRRSASRGRRNRAPR
jgi:hypothetical protein